MLLWQTEKRWKYKGRTCEIQRTHVGDATQYRGLVEVETGVSDRALERSPVGSPTRKRRPKRGADGEHRTWLCFDWSGEPADLRDAVNDLAEHVRDAEL